MEQKKNINKNFINFLTKKGKKVKAELILNKTLILLKKKTKQKPDFVLLKSIRNLMLRVKLITISKKSSKILIYLIPEKQIKFALKLLTNNIVSKKFIDNLTNNIVKTFYNNSNSIDEKKKIIKQIKKFKYNIKI